MNIETGISAIVVTYFSGDILRTCLTSLLASPDCDEIVLVNNGNPEGVVEALSTWAQAEPRLKLLTGHGNIGFGRACNLGAKAARGPVLAFVNPDCVVEAGTLTHMAALTDAPVATLVGGHIRDAQGLEQRGGRRGPLTPWSACISFLGLGRPGEAAGIWRDFNRNREPMPVEPVDMPVISGALMVTRRETFLHMGGFDEAYFLHVEDIDLCRRYGQSGGRVIFDPRALATHVGGTSQIASWRVEIAKFRSFLYYFWKFARPPFGHFGVILIAPMLALAALKRIIAPK